MPRALALAALLAGLADRRGSPTRVTRSPSPEPTARAAAADEEGAASAEPAAEV